MNLYITLWRNQINVWFSEPTRDGIFGTFKPNELDKAKKCALLLIDRNKKLNSYTIEKHPNHDYMEWF